jgi:hypothetical protein
LVIQISILFSILDDLDFAKEHTDDEDFALIHNALQFSDTALRYDMKQLPTQICARILTLGTDQSEYVQELVRQAQAPPFPCLVTMQGKSSSVISSRPSSYRKRGWPWFISHQ